jgi:hypothetical protein
MVLLHKGEGVAMRSFPEQKFPKLKSEKQGRQFSGDDRGGAATKATGVFCNCVAVLSHGKC